MVVAWVNIVHPVAPPHETRGSAAVSHVSHEHLGLRHRGAARRPAVDGAAQRVAVPGEGWWPGLGSGFGLGSE
eukprot:scaffold96826_cov39-Phaeocystis_antarctica.AAC.1